MQKYTKEWLEELCKNSYSYAEVLKKAGRSQGGGSQESLKSKIKEYNIDTSHFTGQRWQNSPNQKDNHEQREQYSIDEIFVENSKVTQKVLRGYIARHNILEYKCQNCGCDGTWLSRDIALEVDHINGNNSDNRIENLRYLCPNCHALTKTYRGRNKALKNITTA